MQDTPPKLKRELRLSDLVLMQLLLVVALNFSGYAAQQGRSQIVLWLLALFLFYFPLALIVIQLSRAIPLEGGVYQWVKHGISPFAGYMAAWSLAVYCIFFFASYGSQLAAGFAYAGGQNSLWMGTSFWFPLLLTVLLSLLAYFLNVRGLRAVKWLSGAGSILTLIIFFTLLALLLRALFLSHSSFSSSFSLALPGFSLLSINVFTKMALFALSGFDQCAVFAEECRKPKNDVARSVLIAAPLIGFIYIVATASVLAYLAPSRVDLAAPVSQVLQIGFGATAFGRLIVGTAIVGFSIVLIASLVLVVSMVARLPMVAGWDGVLPAWWSELHPEWKTPSKAIAAVALTLTLVAALSLLGAHNQEAVQVLLAAAYGSYCLMYLLLFGAVVFGFSLSAWRPGMLIRLTALAAFCVVLLCLAFQLIPVGEVSNTRLFALKVVAAICAANGLGAFFYFRTASALSSEPAAIP